MQIIIILRRSPHIDERPIGWPHLLNLGSVSTVDTPLCVDDMNK